jgi:hypothetical protein
MSEGQFSRMISDIALKFLCLGIGEVQCAMDVLLLLAQLLYNTMEMGAGLGAWCGPLC